MVREGLIYNDTVHVVFIFSGTGTVIVTSFDTEILYYLLERLSEIPKNKVMRPGLKFGKGI